MSERDSLTKEKQFAPASVKLTKTQFKWLAWLAPRSPVALMGVYIVAQSGDKTNGSAALPFLNLVAKGCVEADNGLLRITEYGKRILTP